MTNAMRNRPLEVGLILPETERQMNGGSARWSDLAQMARLGEAIGADSLWFTDHLIHRDPEIAPGVGTPVRGGLSYREAHLALELVAESELLTSLEVVVVNPILDHADETGALAVELAASALGARIL